MNEHTASPEDEAPKVLTVRATLSRVTLSVDNRELSLTDTECRILFCLGILRGQFVPQRRLVRRIYGQGSSRDPVWHLEQDMAHLRMKLETLLGIDPIRFDADEGYCLDGSFEIVMEDAPIGPAPKP